ncbi:MAG: SH3 domain-containing protein [Bacteroidia bacterium]|nr:SH3 domain-containing protein [Bacteroidia bacterium]
MKKLITLLSTVSILFFMVACGGGEDSNSATQNNGTEGADTDNSMAITETDMGSGDVAVCLWPTVGLRDKAGRSGAKYITGIKFGETVKLTGETEEIESEKRTYLEMELSDGKKGWANEYLFAVNGKAVVATADIDVFKRPDLSTLTTNKVTSGSLFAIAESKDKAGWAEVFTQEKKVAGWTQYNEDLFTDEAIDIALGKVLSEVKGLKSTSEKIKKLESVSSSSTFSGSSLMPMVTEMLEKLDKGTNLPNTQLMITAENLNVRSSPDNTADNVAFQLNDGDICEILQRGKEMVKIRDMEDYWYQIEKDGQTGWVYGFFTSKKQ